MTGAEQLIGKPWRAGARGPDAFDCWGLLVWVYSAEFCVTLPPLVTLNPKDVLAAANAFTALVPAWRQLKRPKDMCAVAMSYSKRIHHVGIWLEEQSGVLHAMERSSVVFQSLASIRSSGFQTVKFYELLK